LAQNGACVTELGRCPASYRDACTIQWPITTADPIVVMISMVNLIAR
jgi:hypothetical protein